jgi:hypothetical protein
MEEKHRNFIGFNSYRNFSYESLWNFGTQELIHPNPLEFLWDAFLHASFGGK